MLHPPRSEIVFKGTSTDLYKCEMSVMITYFKKAVCCCGLKIWLVRMSRIDHTVGNENYKQGQREKEEWKEWAI